jgi:pimeloyl-ACP methyl ester carboxylesterase
MSDQFEHEMIPVNGVRLHVVSAGSRDGEPVILLHGFPEFWRGWYRQIEPLAQAGFHVIVPDQRGYNLSETPKDVRAYSLDNLSADVTGLLDHFGYPTAALVGHDWGAGVAWYTAIRHPERISHLGILNAPHPAVMLKFLRRPSQMLKSWYIAFFQIPGLPEWLLGRNRFAGAANVLLFSSKPRTFSDDDIAEYRRAWANSGGLARMIHWYRALVRFPPALPAEMRLPMPVLILWGRNDVALSYEMAEASLEYCPDGELVTLDQASHWVQHDEPEAVNQALLDFLEPTPGGEAYSGDVNAEH